MQKSVEEQKATEMDLNNLFKVAEIALLNTEVGEVIDFNKMLTESSYGTLTETMRHAMVKYIKGKTVYDLGAGDLIMSKAILEIGAKAVVAIDKKLGKVGQSENIKVFEGSFREFMRLNPSFRPSPGSVAFVSWPANHYMEGLVEILSRFKTVIYLGKNTDGRACAWPSFFKAMSPRQLLEHVPHRRNTFIVWGKVSPTIYRDLVLEERAGMDQSKMYNFKEST